MRQLIEAVDTKLEFFDLWAFVCRHVLNPVDTSPAELEPVRAGLSTTSLFAFAATAPQKNC